MAPCLRVINSIQVKPQNQQNQQNNRINKDGKLMIILAPSKKPVEHIYEQKIQIKSMIISSCESNLLAKMSYFDQT